MSTDKPPQPGPAPKARSVGEPPVPPSTPLAEAPMSVVLDGFVRMVERQAVGMEKAGEAFAAELRVTANRLMLVVLIAMVLNTSIVVGAIYLRVGPAEMAVVASSESQETRQP